MQHNPIIAERSLLHVSACPHPFEQRRIDLTVPVGLTIAEIIDLLQPDVVLRQHGAVFIGDTMVAREWWGRIRPKAGTLISIRLLPHGGGGLRIGLMVLVVVAALALTLVTGGMAAPVLFGISGAMLGTIGAAAIMIGGSLLINTLLQPPLPKLSKDRGNESPSYAIAGQRNQEMIWGKLPFVAGLFKVTPPYAAKPYREVVGGQIYWHAVFAISHGPVNFGEIRIGSTPLTSFTDYEEEWRRGYWTLPDQGNWDASTGVFPANPDFGDTWTVSIAGTADGYAYVAGQTITFNNLYPATSYQAWDLDQGKPFTVFWGDVYEDSIEAEVVQATPVVHRSQIGADSIGIDIIFERGLAHIENNPPGRRADLTAVITIEQSPAGLNDWTTVQTKTITGRQTTPLYWGLIWASKDFGTQDANKQYDVRVTRVTADYDEDRNFGNFTWYALRTYTQNALLPLAGISYLALKIKSSGQLTGVLDELNLDVHSMARAWDGAAWEWAVTANPAALFRSFLQHPTRRTPATDAQIDLTRLAYWSEFCADRGFRFDGVFESKGSLYDALKDVALVGWAVPTLRDLKWSVIIDEPKTTPVRLFTPRNSWNYSGEMTHAATPQAYRIGFVNADRAWATEEVLVYDDGYNESNATRVERVEWPGITNRDRAWQQGRFHLAQQRLRREIHKIDTDFEHLCCERGDLVALQHDAVAVGLGSARVVSVTDDGTHAQTITLDTGMVMEGGKSYCVRARRLVSGDQQTDLYAVNTVAGTQTTLTLTTPPLIADAPAAGDLVAFGEYATETRRLLVRDIVPKNDLSATLTLIDEAYGIHTLESGIPIPAWDPGITRPFVLAAPEIVTITSTTLVYGFNRAVQPKVIFSLRPPNVEGTSIVILYRLTGTDGQWESPETQETTDVSCAVTGPRSGDTYDFRLSRTHPSFLSSPLTQVNSYQIIGRSAAPAGLQNLTISIFGGQAYLRWSLPADLDVQYGGVIRFRHSPSLAATWGTSTTIGQAINGDQIYAMLPLKPGTYLARVYDSDGNESATTASVTTKQAAVLEYAPVQTLQEDPTFSGTKTNCEVVTGALQLTDTSLAGTYAFSAGIDFGTVRLMRLTSHVVIEAFSDANIDGDDLWDSLEDVDGTNSALVDAQVWGSTTDDDPAGSPTWSDLQRIDSVDIDARAVGQLECRLTSDNVSFNLRITELRLSAEQVA